MPPKGAPVYPKGSPKYNMRQANSKKIMKKASPRNTKATSPKAESARASWNRSLEKSLVDILHGHNTPYYRGQNGWSAETWNIMHSLFLAKHTFVKFTKAQVQDKEKDLKRDYRALKEARKQSGAGWCEETHKLQAEPHLWKKMIGGIGARLKKFKKKSFPLYDSLGDLYDGHLADGKLNFTSTAGPSAEAMESAEECEFLGEVNTAERIEYEQGEVNIAQRFRDQLEDEQVDAAQRSREHQGDNEQVDDQVVAAEKKSSLEQLRYDAAQRKKAQLEQRKKNAAARNGKSESSEALVGVMTRFVDIKEKEALKEEAVDFSISKCMAVLRTLPIDAPVKVKCYDVFKCPENREIFINAAEESKEEAVAWLKSQITK